MHRSLIHYRHQYPKLGVRLQGPVQSRILHTCERRLQPKSEQNTDFFCRERLWDSGATRASGVRRAPAVRCTCRAPRPSGRHRPSERVAAQSGPVRRRAADGVESSRGVLIRHATCTAHAPTVSPVCLPEVGTPRGTSPGRPARSTRARGIRNNHPSLVAHRGHVPIATAGVWSMGTATAGC